MLWQSFIPITWKLNVLLHVLYKIINKMCAKVVIAQNNTDLPCTKLDINVSKSCAFVKHFETLISSLIQDISVSFRAITTFTYILFIIVCRTCKRTLKFPWNSDKTFLI